MILNYKQLSLSLFIVILLVTTFSAAILGNVYILPFVVVVLFSFSLLKYSQLFSEVILKNYFLVFSIAIAFVMMFNIWKVGFPFFYHGIVVLYCCLIGYVLARMDDKSVFFIARLILFCYCGFLLGNFAYDHTMPYLYSRPNSLTSILLFFIIFYNISYFYRYKKYAVGLPTIAFIFCIIVRGRAGIICLGAVLFFSVLGALLKTYSNKRALFIIGAFFIIVLYWGNIYSYMEGILMTTRMVHGLEDSSRLAMRTEYLRGLGATELLIGGSYDSSSMIYEYAMNPHNSFIRAHFIFGLPYLLCLLLLFGQYLWYSTIVLKYSMYPLLLLLIYMVRSYFDTISFPTVFDILWFYIIFRVLLKKSAGYYGPSMSRAMVYPHFRGKKTKVIPHPRGQGNPPPCHKEAIN